MNILAFDTCFDACSVAVICGTTGCVTSERELMRRGHAEALLPMMDRTMRAAGLTFHQLDRIAVTHGPGTFTGTRVGVSAALGLSLAHDLPVVAYSSLECVARAVAAASASHPGGITYDTIVVARDARRDNVYLEITDRQGHGAGAPVLLPAGEARRLVCASMPDAGRIGNHLVFGSGAGLLADPAIPGLKVLSPLGMPAGLGEPDARFMLEDAASRRPVEPLMPLYLRPPDAKPSSVPPLARVTAVEPSRNA